MSRPHDDDAPREAAFDEAEVLSELGQGFAWPLDDKPALNALVQPLRAGLVADGAAAGSTPFLPEGAAGLAGRLGELTREGASRVVAFDADPVSVEALALLGHPVLVVAAELPASAYEGPRARHADLVEVEERGLHEAWPEERQGAFAGALVDGAVHPTRLVPAVSRALLATGEEGVVGVTLHPLQRDHARVCGELLPAALVERHDESSGRLVACLGALGPRFVLSDFPWDLWLLRKAAGSFALNPAAARSEEDLEGYDPELLRHGTLEVHDVVAGEDLPAQVDAALDEGLARAGVSSAGGHGSEQGRFLHRFRALEQGGHLALVCDREAGVINVELFRWTPRLQSGLVSALVDHVPRRAGAVRFTREAA